MRYSTKICVIMVECTFAYRNTAEFCCVKVERSNNSTSNWSNNRSIQVNIIYQLTQINPSLFRIIKEYDLSGFEILKFDCGWYNYLRIIVPHHGTNNSGVSCVKWSITYCTPFSVMEEFNSSVRRFCSVDQSHHCVCG